MCLEYVLKNWVIPHMMKLSFIYLSFSLSLFHANSMVTKTINAIESREMNCHFSFNEELRTLHKKGHFDLLPITILLFCKFAEY